MMKPETKALLRMAKLLGYKKVGINMYDSDLPNCSFYRQSSYVCAWPDVKFDGYRVDGYEHTCPAIWYICYRLGIAHGAGNGHTKQIKYQCADSGVYELDNII